MPWSVKKKGGKFVVAKNENGKIVGTHDTRQKAEAQVRALYANEDKKGGGRYVRQG